jgi:hypothetical protein
MPPVEGDQIAPEQQQHQDLLEAIRQRDEALAQANQRLERMEGTLNALTPQPGQQQQLPAGKRFAIPAHIRQQIAGLGLSEQEIERNGDIIVPFLQAYLGQAAGEMLALLRNQQDDITQINMLRDGENFPHADALYADVKKVREAEAKAGRYMPVDVAYRVALANNYEKVAGAGHETAGGAPGGQFGASGATRPASPPPPSPAALRSRDLGAGANLRGMRAPVTAPERPVQSKDDLMSMTREERKSFFEQNKETPIR